MADGYVTFTNGVRVLVVNGVFATIDRATPGSTPDQFARWGSENTAIRVRDGKLVTCQLSDLTQPQYAHIGQENNVIVLQDGCIVAGSPTTGETRYIHLGDGLPTLTTRGGVVNGGLGSSGVTYDFRVEFGTNASTPVTSYTGEVGSFVGVDAANKWSVSGGKLNSAGINVASADPLFRTAATFARLAGRAALGNFNYGALGALRAGWDTTTTTIGTYALLPFQTSLFVVDGGTLVSVPITVPAATEIDWAIVQQGTGALYFLKLSGTWEFIWYSRQGTAALYAGYCAHNTNVAWTNAYLRGRVLPAPFNADLGVATLNIASPTNNTDYTATADQLIDLTVTAPGTLTGETAYILFNYQDASNYWRAGFPDTGAFEVDSVSAGTPTNRITVAGVITGGATRTIRIRAKGSIRDAFTFTGTAPTKRGSQLNISHLNTVGTVRPEITAGYAMANLISIPINSSQYSELDRA